VIEISWLKADVFLIDRELASLSIIDGLFLPVTGIVKKLLGM